MPCPISLFRSGLETCVRHLSPCVGPRFFTKYFQLKKLPAGIKIKNKKTVVYMLAKGKNYHANI
jgi:hypothetical protein